MRRALATAAALFATTTAEIRAVIAANKQINATAAAIRVDVAAQEPSSENGTKAKKLALRELDLIIRANEYEIRADRNALKHRFSRANAWLRKSDRVFKQYQRTSRRAVRAFHAAGQDVPKSGAGSPS